MSIVINRVNKCREYLNYIEDHYYRVQESWFMLQEKCEDIKFIYDDNIFNWIDTDVKNHDLSKLSHEEFMPYRQNFFATAEECPIHPAVFTIAWEHHKTNNPHHWENWVSKYKDRSEIAEVNCVHMIIDWMAMGLKFNDTAQEYYEKNKDRISLPDWAVKFIYEIFERLEK